MAKDHYRMEINSLLRPVKGWCRLCKTKPSHFASHVGAVHGIVELFLDPSRHVGGGSSSRKRKAANGHEELVRWKALVEGEKAGKGEG